MLLFLFVLWVEGGGAILGDPGLGGREGNICGCLVETDKSW